MRPNERRWVLVRTFYQSYRSFHALMEQYERRVASFVQRYGKQRSELRLEPEELISLFDSDALLELRDGELSQLKDVAHELFRRLDVPDPFGTHVTNIYHEVSLLKEEHWTVRETTSRMDDTEYDRYYSEVNVYYPQRLRHVETLYAKAKRRLEASILPGMARNKIIVRSVYLFGDRLLRGVYEGGLEEFYGYVYPNGGALTGYTLAADSFIESGFAAEAVEGYGRAIGVLDERIDEQRALESPDAEKLRHLETQRRNLERSRDRAMATG